MGVNFYNLVLGQVLRHDTKTQHCFFFVFCLLSFVVVVVVLSFVFFVVVAISWHMEVPRLGVESEL